MSNAIVSNVYRYVIDDVINQVRGDFEDMGIDDAILQELQRSWESKVARSRVANFGFKDDNGYYEEDGDNSNGGGNSEYAAQATAASLANLATAAGRSQPQPPPPQQQQQQQSQQQQQHQQQQQQGYTLPPPPRMIPDPSTLVNQYQMMQPPLNNNNNSNNEKPQNNNLPELQLPGIPRPNIPQNDGSNELTTQEIDQQINDIILNNSKDDNQITFTASKLSGESIDLDSLPDSVKQLMKDAREKAMKQDKKLKSNIISQLDGEGDDTSTTNNEETVADDDEINSELDDTDEDDEDGEGGEEIEHIILCLYDKVTRTKNKWKCVLKDGIMLVNGRDYLFFRATGEFEW